MTISKSNPKVDAYLKKAKQWPAEIAALRKITLACGLSEELKWNKPCYAFEKSNVAIIIPMKESCALMFAKGALLKDAKKLLTKPGENTQSGRWIKFTALREITKLATTLKAYLKEAIAAEKAGLKVAFKKTSDYAVPEELQKQLDASATFKTAFNALTPGRQRGYLLFFAGAKQSTTRTARVEKCRPQIMKGKGLNE